MPSARRLIDGVGSIPHREPAVAIGAVALALSVGRVAGRGQVFCHRLRVVLCQVDGEMVQTALRGVDLRPRRVVETLTSAGFEVAVEQVSMSFGGHALPGKRELYLALMHPTLG